MGDSPTNKIKAGTMAGTPPAAYRRDVIERLFVPLRTTSTWRLLVHTLLDVPIGMALFYPAVVLLTFSGLLLITLPLALPVLWALFLLARLASTVERSRLAALHGVALRDPVPVLQPGSLWNRLVQRVRSVPRWKEVGYCVLRLPIGIALAFPLVLLWCGSLAIAALPLYVRALPDDVAHFGLFEVGFGPAAFLMALAGMAGLVLLAPWATVLAGNLDAAFTAWLLGADTGAQLVARVTRAETSRVAAVDAAEAERRRIERDLHDGAQQRLVALAMDLGSARERFDTDPEGARTLVAEAHEEAKAALREVRDLVRGIHPVILEDRGLDAALSAVVARSPIPVTLQVDVRERPSPAVESTAYFVVSEALANVARHAGARQAQVAIARRGDRLIVEVRDDGVGGADPLLGTGLAGLSERVAGMAGTMTMLSPLGGPTTLTVELPCAS